MEELNPIPRISTEGTHLSGTAFWPRPLHRRHPPSLSSPRRLLLIWFVIWLPGTICLAQFAGYDFLLSHILVAWWTGITLGLEMGIFEKLTMRITRKVVQQKNIRRSPGDGSIDA